MIGCLRIGDKKGCEGGIIKGYEEFFGDSGYVYFWFWLRFDRCIRMWKIIKLFILICVGCCILSIF